MRKEVDRVNHRDPNRSEDALEVMHAIVHLYRSQQMRVLRDGPHGLAHMELKALGFFARHPGATQSDLVTHSGRDKAQVARLIRSLREGGLLEATPDELDRRSTRLSLSASGQEIFAGLHRQSGDMAAVALTGMAEEEKTALMELLARVRANLESRQD